MAASHKSNLFVKQVYNHKYHVIKMEQGKNTSTMQTVLNPFFLLRGVSSAKVSGSVSSEYTAQLERTMTTRRSESDDATYPVTRSDINMDPAVLWRWKHAWNA